MIDISDGLSSDLNHICNSCGLGHQIIESKIPIHQQTKDASIDFNIDHVSAALYGGEDYELLFTISPQEKTVIDSMEGLSIIGEMTDDKNKRTLISPTGKKISINKKGWNHF